ncbi:hypothetical protein, variant [Capsaspora owczarzaki ATCC 30864]|uniref:Peptidase M20 dimerisation domain-containing protein n=1 Tax=Capsaspora owczarzaki (strain ATCC 30864) TaxID=595528 RepID=A0A0D2WXW2_CAPO3|nr:hypothetical protein, variant [Capsaspora owczarzaki ATCC 30864]
MQMGGGVPAIADWESDRPLHSLGSRWAGTAWHLTPIAKSPSASPMLYISSKPWPASGSGAKPFSKVLILGHVDVVPMATYGIEGEPTGVIRGRGVSDMKGPVAALMHLLKSLNPANLDLAMLVVTDEEIGGIDGAKFAFADAEGPHISCDMCLCPDGGDNFKLVTHEKGVFRIELTASGKSAHSAYPWNGDNAVLTLIDEIGRVGSIQHDGKPVFDNVGPQWHSTCVPTIIQGGQVINQVPGSASAKIDMRFTETWTLDTLKTVVFGALASSPNASKIRAEVVFEQPMLLCPPELPCMIATKKVMEDHVHHDVEYSRGHGTSDGHWADFPVVMFKPIGGGLHQDDEWVDFPSILTFYDICADVIKLFA